MKFASLSMILFFFFVVIIENENIFRLVHMKLYWMEIVRINIMNQLIYFFLSFSRLTKNFAAKSGAIERIMSLSIHFGSGLSAKIVSNVLFVES